MPLSGQKITTDHNLSKKLPIILATESRYKKQVLNKLGVSFNSASPNIDESVLPNETPKALVLRLANEKAQVIARDFPDSYIIAADQVACFNNQILGKPGTKVSAIKQLLAFSGNQVQFLTGLALFDAKTKQVLKHVEEFNVVFRHLKASEIDRYLDIERPYDCAGSFKSEGLGILLFSKLDGRDPNALVGLPLIALAELFNKLGINLLEHAS